jgi:hypothetical protein
MGKLERRLEILELRTNICSVAQASQIYTMTSAEALEIFDILVEADAIEDVLLANSDYQPPIAAIV